MTNRKQKFDNSQAHRAAILHMIGQSVDVFQKAPSIADVAAWMNVCKRTATKYLKQMQRQEVVYLSREKYKNTFMYRVHLSHEQYEDYKRGVYHPYYQLYASRVLGVIAL